MRRKRCVPKCTPKHPLAWYPSLEDIRLQLAGGFAKRVPVCRTKKVSRIGTLPQTVVGFLLHCDWTQQHNKMNHISTKLEAILIHRTSRVAMLLQAKIPHPRIRRLDWKDHWIESIWNWFEKWYECCLFFKRCHCLPKEDTSNGELWKVMTSSRVWNYEITMMSCFRRKK